MKVDRSWWFGQKYLDSYLMSSSRKEEHLELTSLKRGFTNLPSIDLALRNQSYLCLSWLIVVPFLLGAEECKLESLELSSCKQMIKEEYQAKYDAFLEVVANYIESHRCL